MMSSILLISLFLSFRFLISLRYIDDTNSTYSTINTQYRQQIGQVDKEKRGMSKKDFQN